MTGILTEYPLIVALQNSKWILLHKLLSTDMCPFQGAYEIDTIITNLFIMYNSSYASAKFRHDPE